MRDARHVVLTIRFTLAQTSLPRLGERLRCLISKRKACARVGHLQEDLARARREFNDAEGSQLREANGQLVLAALQAEAAAETSASNFSRLTRTSQRDALTDTSNRASMLDQMERAIAMARRHQSCIAIPQ